MIERIAPYHINSRKRLVKSPKLYFSDTGILHSFLGISSPEALLIHPIKGTSLESFVLQNIRAALPDHRVSFYRTAKGAELDFILEKDGIVTALEVKSSSTPHLTKGFWIALEDVKPAHTWIVAPLTESYDIKENITISSLEYFLTTMVQKQ